MVSANLVADAVSFRPSTLRSVSGPTRLRLADLLHITDRTADDVLSGHYDHVVPPGGVPTDDRWFARLHGDDEVDIWLISWVPGHRTELHDIAVRVAGRIPLGRRKITLPTARSRGSGRVSVGLGA